MLTIKCYPKGSCYFSLPILLSSNFRSVEEYMVVSFYEEDSINKLRVNLMGSIVESKDLSIKVCKANSSFHSYFQQILNASFCQQYTSIWMGIFWDYPIFKKRGNLLIDVYIWNHASQSFCLWGYLVTPPFICRYACYIFEL